MKPMLALALILFALSAHSQSATQLTCWNMYAAKGSKPILRAQIAAGNVLNLEFNLQDSYFELYTFSGEEQVTAGVATKKGAMVQPEQNLAPSEITSKRSSYIGNNEYLFSLGQARHTLIGPDGETIYDNTTDYGARLVLPKDLSPEALKAFRIRTPQERSNAVVMLTPSPEMSQGGDNYLRMYCLSK